MLSIRRALVLSLEEEVSYERIIRVTGTAIPNASFPVVERGS